MQDITTNFLQDTGFIGAPDAVLDPSNDSEHCCFTGSNSGGDPSLYADKFPILVPGSVDLLDDQSFSFLWNDESGHAGPPVVPEDSGTTDGSAEDFPSGILGPMLQGETLSSEVYQEPPTLSPTTIYLPLCAQRVPQSSDMPPELDIPCSALTARQKISHSRSERRYRRNLDAMFSQLEDAVNPCPDENSNFGSRPSRRVQRVKLLGMARLKILELQGELKSTKKKLQILREATVPPEALKFTLQDESL